MSLQIEPGSQVPFDAAIPLAPPGGRLGPRWLNRLRSWFGLPTHRRLGQAGLALEPIRRWEESYRHLSDTELKQVSRKLRGRARGGEPLERLLPEAFGLACVAAVRTTQMRPYDVQLAAGVVLHHGALAELATGEGKTLTAALPAYLNALPGKGVHVITSNEYLARRDAALMTPIYQALGLKVGSLLPKMSDQDRQAAYACDITYGTAADFGFDFLRDRLKASAGGGSAVPLWQQWRRGGSSGTSAAEPVQRGHFFALVDEADNIFIDEARTPLVISSPTRPTTPDEQLVYHWADRVARSLIRDQDFQLDDKKGRIELLKDGKQKLRWANPPAIAHGIDVLEEHVERALHAHHRLARDQHYLIDAGKIVLIDESTGRPMPDRHLGNDLHQAVEAKEAVTITKANDHAAQITYQTFFRLYEKLAGMSGTAAENSWELFRVYRLWVVRVPTNRPILRQHWPDRVFPTEDAKFAGVVAEVARLQEQGRPVLIGTRSVEHSEKLSQCLQQAGIVHEVLNARQHAREAEIVAEAGHQGRVTIATNMAGRGTDIKLGPHVAAVGGLHVLGTERHESGRIDRQLSGRAGRQGDPGSAQFFVSLEDELLEALGPAEQTRLQELGRSTQADWQGFLPRFVKAQRRLEHKHYRQRMDLLAYHRERLEILEDIGADPYVD